MTPPLIRERSALLWRVAFVLAEIVNIWVLLTPTPGPPPPFPLADKLVHVALFAVPTYCAVRGRVRQSVLPALVVWAVVSELLQLLVLPMRQGDVWDVVADITGIGLGLGAGLLGDSLLVRSRRHRDGAPAAEEVRAEARGQEHA